MTYEEIKMFITKCMDFFLPDSH